MEVEDEMEILSGGTDGNDKMGLGISPQVRYMSWDAPCHWSNLGDIYLVKEQLIEPGVHVQLPNKIN